MIGLMSLLLMQDIQWQSSPTVTIPVERAVQEFNDICLSSLFDKSAFEAAMKRSSFTYVPDPAITRPISWDMNWLAPEAGARLQLPRSNGAAKAHCMIDVHVEKDASEDRIFPLLKEYASRIATSEIKIVSGRGFEYWGWDVGARDIIVVTYYRSPGSETYPKGLYFLIERWDKKDLTRDDWKSSE